MRAAEGQQTSEAASWEWSLHCILQQLDPISIIQPIDVSPSLLQRNQSSENNHHNSFSTKQLDRKGIFLNSQGIYKPAASLNTRDPRGLSWSILSQIPVAFCGPWVLQWYSPCPAWAVSAQQVVLCWFLNSFLGDLQRIGLGSGGLLSAVSRRNGCTKWETDTHLPVLTCPSFWW